jgi:hypothetical protein
VFLHSTQIVEDADNAGGSPWMDNGAGITGKPVCRTNFTASGLGNQSLTVGER